VRFPRCFDPSWARRPRLAKSIGPSRVQAVAADGNLEAAAMETRKCAHDGPSTLHPPMSGVEMPSEVRQSHRFNGALPHSNRQTAPSPQGLVRHGAQNHARAGVLRRMAHTVHARAREGSRCCRMMPTCALRAWKAQEASNSSGIHRERPSTAIRPLSAPLLPPCIKYTTPLP
jgi:hypothetical protein